MSIIAFLLFMGIMYLIAFVASNVVILIVAPLAFLFKVREEGTAFITITSICNAFVIYLLASLIALLTLLAYQRDNDIGWFIAYSIMGALAVFGMATTGVAAKAEEGTYAEERQQRREHNKLYASILPHEPLLRDTSIRARNDGIIALASVPLFILCLVVPAVATNPVTTGLFHLGRWLMTISVLRWVIGIIGLVLGWGAVKTGAFGGIAVALSPFFGSKERSDAGADAARKAAIRSVNTAARADEITYAFGGVIIERGEEASALAKTDPMLSMKLSSVMPLSMLPYPKEEIIRAFKLNFFLGNHDKESAQSLLVAYSYLAKFLPDDEVDEVFSDKEGALSVALDKIYAEEKRLKDDLHQYLAEMNLSELIESEPIEPSGSEER